MADNQSLIASQNSPGFAQQGQLDWLAIARTPVAFTLDVLARYGRAGVEPVTVAMGRAVCFGFDLRSETQKQLEESRSKLKTISSYGKIAWFGFGLRHIIDDLLDTEQGSACVALCGCLTSCYDVDFTSQVVRKLCEIKGAPTDLTPSIRQWTALVRICAGVLSNSQFPHLLTGFERLLNRYHQEQGCPTPPDPELLARAINTLGLLSKRNLRSVTYSGGLDCAWIAAMAQWMLCLGVEINDGRGNTLYRSKSLHSDEIAQVIINIDASYPDQASSLTQKTFSIPQGKSLFFTRDTTDCFSHSAVRMAVPWTEILGASFGKENMDSLFNALGFTFAMFLKTMSLIPGRVMTKMCPWAKLERATGNLPRRKRGKEFLEWALERLPELQPCIEGSLSQLNSPLSKQKLIIDAKDCLEVFRAACKCERCNGASYQIKYCLQVVAVTVLQYLFILSSLSIDESICPSCTGVRLLYSGNLKRYNDWTTKYVDSPRYTLEQILETLTGQQISEDRLDKPASAISANGICIFYDLFLNPNASPLNISTIRVVPGHIEFEHTQYVAIFDTQETHSHPYKSPIYRKDEYPVSYSLLARQKSFDMSIQVSYQIIAKSRPPRVFGLYRTIFRLENYCTWQDCTTWCDSECHDSKRSGFPNRPQGQGGTISDETPFQSRWLAVLLTKRDLEIGLPPHYDLYVRRFNYYRLYFDVITENYAPHRTLHVVRIRNCSKCLLMYALETMTPFKEPNYRISIRRENTEPVVVDVVGKKIGGYEVTPDLSTHPGEVLTEPLFPNVPLNHDPQ